MSLFWPNSLRLNLHSTDQRLHVGVKIINFRLELAQSFELAFEPKPLIYKPAEGDGVRATMPRSRSDRGNPVECNCCITARIGVKSCPLVF